MMSEDFEIKVTPIKFGHANIYLIKTESGCILVDAGMPNKNKELDEAFRKEGVDPKSVQLIILTHGHLDHVGSAAYAQEITGGKILCQRSFSQDLADGKIETAVSQNFRGRILNYMSGLLGSKIEAAQPDIVVDEELDLNEFGIAGKVIHTPGHSSSSISIVLDNGEALIGDLVREENPGQVGLGMFYEDEKTVFESLRKIMAFDPKVIYLSHGSSIDKHTLRHFIDTNQ
jgi:glyoxylase-like metal-dependent hydrolase (beta-lactamase superfamily II)